MARDTISVVQRDFTAGMINFDGRRRDDSKLYKIGLREGRNCRPIATGGLEDRPGREWQYFDAGRPFWARPKSGIRHKISFGDGTFTARNEDNSFNTQLAGCPWTSGMLPDLIVSISDMTMIVCAPGLKTQRLDYDDTANEWFLSDYEFLQELSGDIRQPYFRYAPGGVTLQPSALTGSITLTFSADVLVAGHIGTRFRYYDFEVEITAVASGMSGTATVIRSLPATRAVTVASTAGFSVGDVVEGDTTGTSGVVATVVSSTVLNIVVETPGTDFNNSDILLGPTGRSQVSAVNNASPAAIPIWDEQLVSEVRGYPSGTAFDRSRVVFYGFPQIGRGVLWGEIGAVDAFNIGALATDGIFETLPVNCVVQWLIGGSDQFVGTDIGVFYIPISASAPLQPGSIEFRQIESDGVAPVQPAPTMDGMVFLNEARNRILAMTQTGQTARPYLVEDIGEYHSDLFTSPVALAVSTGSGVHVQQMVYALNADGTLVAGKFNRPEEIVGWFPWQGMGDVKYIAADRGDILLSTEYAVNGGSVIAVEQESGAYPIDCAIPLASTSALAELEGRSLAVYQNGIYRGLYIVLGDGSLSGWSGGTDNAFAGFSFSTVIKPFVGNVDGGEAAGQRIAPRSIAAVAATFNSTAAEIIFCGRVHAAYQALDNEDAAPPPRDKTVRGRVLGRSMEPEIELRRDHPGRLKLLEFVTEVTI